MRVVLAGQLVEPYGNFSYNFDYISLRRANHAVAFALIPHDFLDHVIGERICN
jgi:hypothetical protein